MPKTKRAPSKAAQITKLLTRERGASIDEMVKATGWKAHSVRAFLTGVRKKASLDKQQRNDGVIAYRISEATAADGATSEPSE